MSNTGGRDPRPDGGEGIMIDYEPEPASPAGAQPFTVAVRRGEMALLCGAPGARKSAILSELAGLAGRSRGRALIAGESLSALTHRERRARCRALRMGFVPEIPALVSNLSIIDNVMLPTRYFGEAAESRAWQAAHALLDATGLGWASGRLPGALTLEDRRAVAVIRTLLRRPTVALLDEPLAGLDAASLAGVRPLLKATVTRGECAILALAADPALYASIPHTVIPIPEGWHPAAGEA